MIEYNKALTTPLKQQSLKKGKKSWSDRKLAFILITPPLLFILTFTLYPIIRVFWMSLHKIIVTQPWLGTPFTGVGNYVKMIHDLRFWHSIGFTLGFSILTIAFELMIGLFLAVIANKQFKFRGIVRAAILFPWVMPTIINALAWRWMYNQDYGLFNGLLIKFGLIDHSLNWLGDSKLAFIAICIVAIWKTSSFIAIILLAGLQSISSDIYEAAMIDGASSFQSFIYITLPLLRNVFLVAVVLRTMDAMQAFDLMFGLTQGGPGNSTESLPMYIYRSAFVDMDWGYGSALGVTLFFITFSMTALYVKFLYKPE
ncbi:carbohydrate ABC transporter permease [Niallia sp. 03133]|uniref:carbohydrate ABC transporter permease n=1 Tax=Niallia sp. 03133 TaxID=3458060 RepID=UPI0040444749